jgi:aminopeptidase S
MRPIRTMPLFCALLLAACASTQQATRTRDVAAAWQQQVTAISAGDDTAARGKGITDALTALGLSWHAQAFEGRGETGHNLIAELPGPAGAPLLLIGAHYDRVAVGRGATDNAAGSATVLQLAAAFKARPLRRHRVQVAFWDLEEKGLLGSGAFVKTPGQEKPALYVNFDVFAWGDTLWMMTPTPTGPLVAQAESAARANGLGFRPGTEYPATDHRAFLAAGWPAVSFSLLGRDEIEDTLAAFTGGRPSSVPKAAQVLHSANDTLDKIDATHMPQAIKALEEALRAWDAG